MEFKRPHRPTGPAPTPHANMHIPSPSTPRHTPAVAASHQSHPQPPAQPTTAPARSAERARNKKPRLSNKAIVLIVAAAGAIITIAATAAILMMHTDDSDSYTPQTVTSSNLGFTPVLPTSKAIEQLGGWQRVSPASKDPVYAYTDVINGIEITVSEQPLPKSFEINVDGSVAELAKSYNATTQVKTSGTTVYIGTSAKGPQSVIFTKQQLLMLIKSQKVVADDDWAKYIATLK